MMKTLLPLLALVATALTLQGQSLVAHYPFDGNANDVTRFMNHATVAGAELTAGWDGTPNSAYVFDGRLDSIVAPAAGHLNTPNATYAFWVRVDSMLTEGDGQEYYLLSHGGWQNRVKISLPGHGYPVFTTNTTTGIKDGDSNPEALVEDVWTHLTFVRSNDTNYIYFNGRQSKFDIKEGTLNPTDRPLAIGNNPIDGANYFKGAIDDVRIYSEGLTAAQVASLYESLTTSSVADVDFAQLAQVFPNPVRESLTIERAGGSTAPATAELFDARGVRLFVQQLTSARETIPAHGLPAGMYTLRITDGERAGATRLVVQ